MNTDGSALKTVIIENFGTPFAVIDLEKVERNIKRAQTLYHSARLKTRPNMKTHKSALLAKMQIAAGAEGITYQKLGEAEVMGNNGITDIDIATNQIGAARSDRLASLQRRVSLKVCSDNLFSLKAYSDAAREAERPLGEMSEFDTGQKRAGVDTPCEALALAQVIKEDHMLNFAGLLFLPIAGQLASNADLS